MKPRVHLIFTALMLVMLLAALDATILATALPTTEPIPSTVDTGAEVPTAEAPAP